MTSHAPFLLIASMDVDPDKEDFFNRVYDDEHLPNLVRVPGVLDIVRYERQEFSIYLGGQLRRVATPHPKYLAVYGLESPDVVASEAWREAVELGRWPQQVRPFTRNRQHVLARRLGLPLET